MKLQEMWKHQTDTLGNRCIGISTYGTDAYGTDAFDRKHMIERKKEVDNCE